MSRILFFTCDGSPQSGATRCLARVVAAAREAGHAPVLALPHGLANAFPGAEHRALAMAPPRWLRHVTGALGFALAHAALALRLAWMIVRERIELVHVNEFYDVAGALAARLTGRPLVWHLRWIVEPPSLRRLFASASLRLADRVVVASGAVRDATYPGAPDHVVVVPDPPDETAPAAGPPLRAELGVPGGSRLITLVAKLVPEKGHTVLLDALEELGEVPVCVLLVGAEVPGHEAYARLVRDRAAQLAGRVRCLGLRGDVPRILAASDVAVVPSTFADPYPGVVLEAFQAGCPVVASDAGGITGQLGGGERGLLVPPGEPEPLARAIERVLASAELAARLRAAASRWLAATHPPDRLARDLDGVYRDALRNDPA